MGVEDEKPQPRDPATVLKRDFAVAQTADTGPPRYRMSERNRKKLARMRELVAQLRNSR